MHDHGGIRAGSNRRLLTISLAITASVMVLQIMGAVLSGSLALLADAAHLFTDAAALVIALIASAVAARPANDRRTFGYHRAEVFGALVNAVILIVLAFVVAVEGIQRLIVPRETELAGGIMLVVAVIGLAANLCALWLLGSAQRRSINVRGAYLEVLGDAIGSLAVIAAAITVLVTGWVAADAIASLAIAALIVPRAVGLLREVVSVLAESAPQGTEVAAIRAHILNTPGVATVHDVHVWQLTRGAPVFTAHVVVDEDAFKDGEAGRILAELQSCLSEHFDVDHSTFQLESAKHQEPRAHR